MSTGGMTGSTFSCIALSILQPGMKVREALQTMRIRAAQGSIYAACFNFDKVIGQSDRCQRNIEVWPRTTTVHTGMIRRISAVKRKDIDRLCAVKLHGLHQPYLVGPGCFGGQPLASVLDENAQLEEPDATHAVKKKGTVSAKACRQISPSSTMTAHQQAGNHLAVPRKECVDSIATLCIASTMHRS